MAQNYGGFQVLGKETDIANKLREKEEEKFRGVDFGLNIKRAESGGSKQSDSGESPLPAIQINQKILNLIEFDFEREKDSQIKNPTEKIKEYLESLVIEFNIDPQKNVTLEIAKESPPLKRLIDFNNEIQNQLKIKIDSRSFDPAFSEQFQQIIQERDNKQLEELRLSLEGFSFNKQIENLAKSLAVKLEEVRQNYLEFSETKPSQEKFDFVSQLYLQINQFFLTFFVKHQVIFKELNNFNKQYQLIQNRLQHENLRKLQVELQDLVEPEFNKFSNLIVSMMPN